MPIFVHFASFFCTNRSVRRGHANSVDIFRALPCDSDARPAVDWWSSGADHDRCDRYGHAGMVQCRCTCGRDAWVELFLCSFHFRIRVCIGGHADGGLFCRRRRPDRLAPGDAHGDVAKPRFWSSGHSGHGLVRAHPGTSGAGRRRGAKCERLLTYCGFRNCARAACYGAEVLSGRP